MMDVWTFRSRQSKVKAIAMYSYAWLATQSSKLSESLSGKATFRFRISDLSKWFT
jgi:hypothetical protein